jgi:putative FmdB family regulatory protein
MRSQVPIFDFVCRTCKHQFEGLVLRGRDVACPKCSGQDLDKLISMPAIKSDDTKARALVAARKRDQAQGKDRMHEQEKYEKSHND